MTSPRYRPETPLPPVTVGPVPPEKETTYSLESGIAPYDTLFHDFDLEAFSFFNYWTPDETTNDTLQLENRSPDEMPRLVKLNWNPAPDLPEQKTAYDKLNPPSTNRKSPRFLGPPATRDRFIVDGVAYSPTQLSPTDFKQIVTALANSDVAPGVINSVVSLPLIAANVMPAQPAYRIDLDSWYTSPSSDGVFISDVRNTFNNRTSGYFSLPGIFKEGVSAKNTDNFNQLFSGKFSVAPSSFANQYMKISSVNPSSPALSTNVRPSITTRPPVPSPQADIFDSITSTTPPPSPSNSVRVKFVDTGIANVAAEARVNAAVDPAHANSIVATSQVLGNLIAYSAGAWQNTPRKINLKSFPAPAGVATKEYVGYLIEKYEQIGGVFTLKQLIGVGDPHLDEYYDTQVKYGAVYHYRIRAVIRWARPNNVGAWGTDVTHTSNMFTSTSVSNNGSMSLTPNLISFFGGEWNNKWATAQIIDDQPPNPPDQLEVRPRSDKKQIIVTFQIPDNSQRDIYMMALWRRLIDANGRTVDDWRWLSVFNMNQPGYYVDNDVEFNPNEGVVYTSRVAEEMANNRFAKPYRYVYAATCLSVHNGESLMSEQIGARLNRDWQQKGEFPVEFFSSRGVDRIRDHGVFSTIPIKRYKTHVVVIPKNDYDSSAPAVIGLTWQQRWALRMTNGNKYILRIHSLDNGETFDIDFTTGLTTVAEHKIQINSNVYVPSFNEQYVYDDQALTSG